MQISPPTRVICIWCCSCHTRSKYMWNVHERSRQWQNNAFFCLVCLVLIVRVSRLSFSMLFGVLWRFHAWVVSWLTLSAHSNSESRSAGLLLQRFRWELLMPFSCLACLVLCEKFFRAVLLNLFDIAAHFSPRLWFWTHLTKHLFQNSWPRVIIALSRNISRLTWRSFAAHRLRSAALEGLPTLRWFYEWAVIGQCEFRWASVLLYCRYVCCCVQFFFMLCRRVHNVS